VVTDLDNKIDENGQIDIQNGNISIRQEDIQKKFNSIDGNIRAFVSPLKTLEFDIAMGSLYTYIDKAIQIAKKIKSKNDWITDEEVKNIQLQDFSIGKDAHERAKIIYEPLEKNQASKSVTAQWFAKLLNDDKENIINLIKKDYEKNTGVKYLIEAIEHVTEKIIW